jgi:hypothetical protein
MKRITLVYLSLLSLGSLSACSTGYEGWSPEQIAAYEQSAAQSHYHRQQQNQQRLNQAVTQANQPYSAPAVQTPVLNANGTYSTAYCRELASDMLTCKVLR